MKAAWSLAVLMATVPVFASGQNMSTASLPRPATIAASASKKHATHGEKPKTASGSGVKEAQVRAAGAEHAFLDMPLDFELNQGQAPAEYAYVAHGPFYALGVSSTGLALSLHRPESAAGDGMHAGGLGANPVESSKLALRLLGTASDSSVTGLDPQAGRSNYFIGNDPAQWRTSVPHFNRVKVGAAYPGIDLVFYGNREQLEYDFAVAPGADPGLIRLQVEGAEAIMIDREGNAILRTAAGDVELQRPKAYQEIDGGRQAVASGFEVAEGRVLKFEVGNYDRGRALIIDPVLVYSAGIGGSNGNQGMGMTVDAAGNAYVSGNTCSADFPATSGNFPTIHTNTAAKNCQDAFVIKLDPTATTLIFSDYIGGAGGSSAAAHVAVDATGNVYVAGGTGATSFPTVANIGRTAPAPCGISKTGYNCPEGFILKLSPDGSQILFSSLLGGSQASGAYQVKLNPVTGDLVVLGETNSSDFLPTPTTLETAFGGGSCTGSIPCFNSFLLGLNASTGALKYGTFLGGAGNDWSSGLAFDGSGNTYVAGSAQPPLSSSLGTVTHTYGPSGTAAVAGTSLFVAKLNLSGTTLTPGYLTLVQADADTGPSSLAVDANGNAYFAGATAAQHLGVTANAFQSTNKATFGASCLWGAVMTPFLPTACGTGLVGKLDPTGALSFLTYLGGSGQEEVEAMGQDGSNNIWLTGVTSSADFPVSADHYNNNTGFNAPFLAEMSNDGTTLPFATLVGGSFGQSTDLFVDKNNNVYITGFSSSVPSTPNTYPDNPQVFSPLFVQKWGPGAAPSISVSPTGLVFASTAIGGVTPPQTLTVLNSGTVPMELGVQLSEGFLGLETSDFLESTNCGTSLAAGASCTITVSFAPGVPSAACLAQLGCGGAQRSAAIAISNNATQGSLTVQLGGTAGVGASLNVSPNPIAFPEQAAGTSSAVLDVQVGSTGDAQLVVSNAALSGANASDFQLSLTGNGGPACTGALQPGSYCTLYITFSPAAAATGTRTATLTLTDTAGDSPQTVSVTGTVAPANALNISPLTLSPTFPAAIGTSNTAVLTLANPSSTNDIQVTSLAVSGTNLGDFTATPASCLTNGSTTLPITAAKGASCLVIIKFTPAAGASGQRTATLTVGTTPAVTGLPTVSLSGDAVTNTDPGLSTFVVPEPMNFGGLQLGETSNAASVLFTVTNNYPIPCAGGVSTCGAPLVISAITPGLSDYTVSSTVAACSTFPATIAIGGNCMYGLVFKPAQAGARNTTVTIQSNDPQGAVMLPVYGSGLSLPLGQFLQTALNFGKSAIGVASPPLTTTLQNSGLSNLTISAVTASTNFAVSANTCTAPLAPQATCTVSVTFTPPSAGPFTGTLTISDNGGFSQQQTVTLAGTGATGPQLRLMPSTLSFENQTVNVLSAAQTVTLTSTGDAALTFPANALRTSTDFVLQSTTCGTTLAVGMSCTANVQFKPSTTTIAESGTLLVTDNAAGSPQPVYMQGTGIAGTTAVSTTVLTSAPNPSGFGVAVILTATVSGPAGNTTVPTGTVNFFDGANLLGSMTLNAGTAMLTTSTLSAGSHTLTAVYIGDATFTGSTSAAVTQVVNPPAKAATTTAVTSSLNPALSGDVVTFTATVTGSSTVPTGSVNFLDGTTVIGGGTLNAAGQTSFGTSSLSAGSHSITAVYGGDTNFNGSTSAALTEVVTAPALMATTTTVASTLNPSTPGQSVTFTATVSGPAGSTPAPTGTITFLDGGTSLGMGALNSVSTTTLTTTALSAGSHSITAQYGGDAVYSGSTSAVLTQTVAAPGFSLSVNPTTLTVTAGMGGTATVSVTPTMSFSDAVSLACSGLPAASNCTFSPGSVTPNGTSAVTSTVTVATDMATASLQAPARRGRSMRTTEAVLAIILIGLGGLVRTRRRWTSLFFAVVLLAGLGAAVTGCGGGGSSGGGPKTPKGTSTITVTGTSGSLSQTTTFTLVVQ